MLTVISQQDTIMQTLRNIQDINTNLSSIFLGYLNDRRAERTLRSTNSSETTTNSVTNNSFENRSRPPLDSELPPRARRNNFFPSVPFSNTASSRTTTPVSPFSFGLDTNINTTSETNSENASTSSSNNLESIHEERENESTTTSTTSTNNGDSVDNLPRHVSTPGASTSSGVTSTSTSNNNGYSLRGFRNTILSAPGSNTVLGRRTRSQRERQRNRSRRNRSSVYNDVDDVLRQPLERRRNRFHTRMSARNTSGSQTRRREWLNIPTVNINSPIGDIAQNILNATMNDSPVRIIASRRQIARATRVVRFSEIETTDENNDQNNEENNNDETICPIDREILQPDDYVMQIIHCGHFFREENLRTHFRRNPRCPLCRFDIRDHGISNEELENRQNNTTSQGTQTRPSYPPPPPPTTSLPPIATNIIRESINSTLGSLYSSVGSLHDIENPFLTRPSSNINPTRQTTSEINGNTITHTQSFTSGTDVSGNNTVLEYSITIQPFSDANVSTNTDTTSTATTNTTSDDVTAPDAENNTSDEIISEAETVEANSSHENTPSVSDDELHEFHQHPNQHQNQHQHND